MNLPKLEARLGKVGSALLTLGLAINLGSLPSYAWNGRGHMMVAAVAYQKLTPQAKDRVDALLLLNPDRDNWFELIPEGTSVARTKMLIFMIAATWSDRIKSDPDYHTDGTHNGNRPPTDGTANNNIGFDDLARHKYWHFIDLPFTLDSTPLPQVPQPNAQTRITDFRAVLASSSSTDELKSYDLSWLLHLVGDVHQPLHCTTRVSAAKPEGDDGGNGVTLSASPGKLHSFWDGVLGGGNSPVTARTAALSLPSAPATAADDLDIQHWIDESFNAAKSSVYKNPPIGAGIGPFTLTQAYKTAARTLAEKRVALAGARLAKILNDELR
jgi:S1/P1 Nuclease